MIRRLGKKNEGPGAGYTVTFKDLKIVDTPKIEYANGAFQVTAPVEYGANAEGYDWSFKYVIQELMDMDDGTEYNPFKGELSLTVPNNTAIWDSMKHSFFADEENPTQDEKMQVLQDSFYKGQTFRDFSGNWGGGYTHSTFEDSVDVCIPADYDGFEDSDFEFGDSTRGSYYAYGTLTIDPQFSQDIEFAYNYDYYRYKLVDAIKEYLKPQGVDVEELDDRLNDWIPTYVTDGDITPKYVMEIISELKDNGFEFYGAAHREPIDVKVESRRRAVGHRMTRKIESRTSRIIRKSSHKQESADETIKMNIDYNTFMRLLDSAAYLDADDEYKDALWEEFSGMGEISGDACTFFDNLFQYTKWLDAGEIVDDYDLDIEPTEEAVDKYLEDNDYDLNGNTARKYGSHYLVLC